MSIIFKSVTYQNFLAVGNNPITVELDKNHTTLITAVNGSGKSTILDAICFALYGKAYRNINKPNLINSINQKRMLVTILFEIGKKKYKIVRGMKPGIFEIWLGDKMINQDPNSRDYQKILETQILKMNFRAFTQVVVMGSSSYIPFMKLRPHERREFIEDLLDIKIFSVMSKILAQKIKDAKENYKDIDTQIKSTKEKIELQEAFIASRKNERSDILKRIQDDIAQSRTNNEVETNSIAIIKENIAVKETSLAKYETLTEQLSELKLRHKTIQKAIDDHNSEKSFYSHAEECPTCKQSIEEAHREHIIGAIDTTMESHATQLTDIKDQLTKLNSKMEKYNAILTEISDLNVAISKHNQNIHGNNLLIQKYEREYLATEADTSNIEVDKATLRTMAKLVVELSKQKRSLIEQQSLQATAQVLLQDSGIKSKIIKQYIPVINKQINKYLTQLDFFCNFNIDENFNEIVKSRYRDEFTYDSFSEGEKLRIDISLLMSWRDVARMKNSVNTNLMIFDELFDGSMDETGIGMVLDIFGTMKNTNIFVISHRENIADKFDASIKFEKKNGFTILAD